MIIVVDYVTRVNFQIFTVVDHENMNLFHRKGLE